MFAVNDTRNARGHNVKFFAVINDSRREVPPEILDAFKTYDINARKWSERNRMVEALAA
jgi:hypothetical protein